MSPAERASPARLGGVGTLDVEFVVEHSGGTTEYLFTQTICDDTGFAWTGFHYVLGFGPGANFVRFSLADLLDFDAPGGDPAPTSDGFSVLDLESDTLDWSGGSIPSAGSLFQVFPIDVPDGLCAFNPSGQSRFTLRQSPIAGSAAVPEPGSLALVGIALGTLLVPRWRFRSP